MKISVRFYKLFETVAILLIIVACFGVRLYKISQPVADWHSWRQVDTASVTRIFMDRGLNLLNPQYYDVSSIQTGYYNGEGLRLVEFPVFNFFHYIFAKALPFVSLEVSGRLTSIVASVITTYLLFLIGKKLVGSMAGLVSAFYFAFMPFNIFFSRVILPEPMATMFAILGVYLFMKYISSESKIFLFTAAIAFALGILVKPFVAFYGVVPVYLAIRKYGIIGTIFNIPLLIALDIAMIPFFIWRIYIFDKVVGIPAFSWMFNGDGIRFRPSFWRWIFGERLGILILGIWGMIPFGFGLLKRDKYGFVHHFFLIGMFLYVSIIATANVRHDYYQTIAIPAVALTLGIGASEMLNYKKLRQRIGSFFLLSFCTFLMFGISFFQVKEYYKINHSEFIRAGQILDSIAPKDAKVVAPDNGNTVLLYYTKRFGWPAVDRSIDEIIALGGRYFISTAMNDTDSVNFKKRFEMVYSDPQFFILDLSKEIKTNNKK